MPKNPKGPAFVPPVLTLHRKPPVEAILDNQTLFPPVVTGAPKVVTGAPKVVTGGICFKKMNCE